MTNIVIILLEIKRLKWYLIKVFVIEVLFLFIFIALLSLNISMRPLMNERLLNLYQNHAFYIESSNQELFDVYFDNYDVISYNHPFLDDETVVIYDSKELTYLNYTGLAAHFKNHSTSLEKRFDLSFTLGNKPNDIDRMKNHIWLNKAIFDESTIGVESLIKLKRNLIEKDYIVKGYFESEKNFSYLISLYELPVSSSLNIIYTENIFEYIRLRETSDIHVIDPTYEELRTIINHVDYLKSILNIMFILMTFTLLIVHLIQVQGLFVKSQHTVRRLSVFGYSKFRTSLLYTAILSVVIMLSFSVSLILQTIFNVELKYLYLNLFDILWKNYTPVFMYLILITIMFLITFGVIYKKIDQQVK